MAKTKTVKAMKTGDALKWAQKKYGKEAMVKHDPKSLTEAEKVAVREAFAKARAERDQLKKADSKTPRYVELMGECNRLSRDLLAYRYSVGHTGLGGMFFMVKGQGDTWEEAIKQAEERGY